MEARLDSIEEALQCLRILDRGLQEQLDENG